MMLMEVKKLSRSEKSVVTLVVDRDTGSRYVRRSCVVPTRSISRCKGFHIRSCLRSYRWSRDKTALRCWKST